MNGPRAFMKTIEFLDMGLMPYNEALRLQQALHSERIASNIPDTVVFCEHYPVYTIGRRDCSADWLSGPEEIAEDGVEIVKTDRGGRITYHGPGQLVAYFIFDINGRGIGVKDFVSRVEDACMATLAGLGVKTERDAGYPGLWANGKKIVAVGFQISRGVSMHGAAINVAPDMSHYRHIIPCGIKDRGVTSINEQTEEFVRTEAVAAALKGSIPRSFE